MANKNDFELSQEELQNVVGAGRETGKVSQKLDVKKLISSAMVKPDLKSKLSDARQQALDNVISKLNEKDQEQIAAAGDTTNDQYRQLQGTTERDNVCIDYGAPPRIKLDIKPKTNGKSPNVLPGSKT